MFLIRGHLMHYHLKHFYQVAPFQRMEPQVPENDNKPIPGTYVAGWAKRGPVGIIDATLRDTK